MMEISPLFQLKNGDSSNAPLLSTHCNTKGTFTATSSGNNMFVMLHAKHNTDQASGFKATFASLFVGEYYSFIVYKQLNFRVEL